MSGRVKIAVVAIIAALAVGIWVVKHIDTDTIVASTVMPVRIETAKVQTLREELRLVSYIDGANTVTVVPKVSGTLKALSVDVGDSVTAGQVIARVDEEAFALALEQALISKEATAREAERAAKLYETGSAGAQAYDQAQVQSEAADAQYRIALLNFDNTRIVAPVSGRVVQRLSNEGALVSQATPLVAIDASADLLVVTQVPERYTRPFMEGTVRGVSVSVPSIGLEGLPASIRHIAPYVKSDSRTFEVTCSVGGDRRALLPGMSVSVSFILDERKDARTLPEQALVGEATLWVLDRETMTGRPVEIGKVFSDGERIELPAEFGSGVEFIVDGQRFLREDLEVRVIGED